MLLLETPAKIEVFESQWSEEFVSAADQMPGVRRVAVSRIHAGLSEQVEYHLMHEFNFEEAFSRRRATASPQGQEAGKLLVEFASDGFGLYFAEHWEDHSQRE